MSIAVKETSLGYYEISICREGGFGDKIYLKRETIQAIASVEPMLLEKDKLKIHELEVQIERYPMSYQKIREDFFYDIQDNGDVILKWQGKDAYGWCYISLEDLVALNAVLPEIVSQAYEQAKKAQRQAEILEVEEKIKVLQQKLAQLRGAV